ncbi:5-fold beta-flower protein, partial [Flavobacterium branchiarum]|uniref:5-fold beta-flower protein n=1 Tax=Flavobacterium branchiarum TaxID=1114870 RepID=UPI00338FBE55
KSDGTVQDRNHSTIGYIKSDGKVEDRNHSTIVTLEVKNKEWAAVVYFFFKFE